MIYRKSSWKISPAIKTRKKAGRRNKVPKNGRNSKMIDLNSTTFALYINGLNSTNKDRDCQAELQKKDSTTFSLEEIHY